MMRSSMGLCCLWNARESWGHSFKPEAILSTGMNKIGEAVRGLWAAGYLEVQEECPQEAERGLAVAINESLGTVRPDADRVGRAQRCKGALRVGQAQGTPLRREVARLHQARLPCSGAPEEVNDARTQLSLGLGPQALSAATDTPAANATTVAEAPLAADGTLSVQYAKNNL